MNTGIWHKKLAWAAAASGAILLVLTGALIASINRQYKELLRSTSSITDLRKLEEPLVALQEWAQSSEQDRGGADSWRAPYANLTSITRALDQSEPTVQEIEPSLKRLDFLFAHMEKQYASTPLAGSGSADGRNLEKEFRVEIKNTIAGLRAALASLQGRTESRSALLASGWRDFKLLLLIPFVLLGATVLLLTLFQRERSRYIRASAALSDSEERFRQLVESNIIGMMVSDFDGNVSEANNAFLRMLGYTREDLAGGRIRWNAITPHEFAERDEDAAAELKSLGACTPFEKEFIRKNGARVPVLIGSAVLKGESAKTVAFVVDLTERKQIENRLDESERFYQLLFERNLAGVYRMSLYGQILDCNDAFAKILGCRSKSEAACLSINEFYESESSRQEFLARLRERGALTSFEHQLRRKGGELIWILENVNLVATGDGMPPVIEGTIIDVTERKNAERALRASEARLRLMIEQAPAILWTTDDSLRLTSAIGRGLKALGMRPNAFNGIGLQEYFGGDEGALAAHEKALKGERVDYDIDWSGRAFQSHVEPFVDIDGKPLGTIGIALDVTERKRSQEEHAALQADIQRSAIEWVETFDSVESPLIILDAAERVVRLNRSARRLSGLSLREAQSRRFVSLGEGEPWNAARQLAVQALESGSSMTTQILESTGKCWDITADRYLLPDSEARIIITIRDITELVRLQQSIRKNDTLFAMGNLVAGVAHEVRNPLFSISATLQAFEARFGGNRDYQRYTDVLKAEIDRLNELMRELLEYGRPKTLELASASLGEILDEAVGACESLAGRLSVNVLHKVNGPIPDLLADRRKMAQVFQNLLENAIQHSPPGGVVVAEAKAGGDNGSGWVDCCVSDSGPGFNSEDLPRIFEPFFSRRRGGTGLGLSIVQRIINEHGGSIVAGNRPEGGAVVKVSLRFSRN